MSLEVIAWIAGGVALLALALWFTRSRSRAEKARDDSDIYPMF